MLMTVQDHVKVITENHSMLVENLSSHEAAFNRILDALQQKSDIPKLTYQQLLIQSGTVVVERDNKVRALLALLLISQATNTFMVFYDALHGQGLKETLNKLLAHGSFQEAERSHVSTRMSVFKGEL